MKKMVLIAALIIFLAGGPLTAQEQPTKFERDVWDIGLGVRLNYLGLYGGFSGYRASDGYQFDIKYKDIGMNVYVPSLAVAMDAKYKRWSFAFAGSRGVYKGDFINHMEICRDTVSIDSGSNISGKLGIGIYALSATYMMVMRKHEFGVGLGFLFMDLDVDYSAINASTGQPVSLGGHHFYPMPFLAIGAKFNFNRFRIIGTGGGAYFNEIKDGTGTTVWYYTLDVRGAYDVIRSPHWVGSLGLGYRSMFMDLKMDFADARGWYHEEDHYIGPYLSLVVKFVGSQRWDPVLAREAHKNHRAEKKEQKKEQKKEADKE